ncbi:MAG: hypothetical protein ACI8XO_002742 [Verrucomicrobiales bacterium]
MDLRDSWIDPDEVSELASEIFPVEKVRLADDDGYEPVPLLDDGGVGDVRASSEAVAQDCDEQMTADRIAERLRAIRVRAERSGLLIGSEPVKNPEGEDRCRESAPIPEPFVLPGGRLIEQVSALVDWLAEDFKQVFVLDELGDELVPGDVPAGLRSGAVRLAQSWERSQRWLREEGLAAEVPVAGAALAGGLIFSVVGIRCAGGFYCAALVGEQMVSTEHAVLIRDALFLVFG